MQKKYELLIENNPIIDFFLAVRSNWRAKSCNFDAQVSEQNRRDDAVGRALSFRARR
jgi:hypothetical protein